MSESNNHSEPSSSSSSDNSNANNNNQKQQTSDQDWDTIRSMTIEMKPIGIFHSCYKFKNATPRQGALAPIGRGRLKIQSPLFAMNNQHHSLMGIEQFSHVWLVYYFHDNNNMEKLNTIHQNNTTNNTTNDSNSDNNNNNSQNNNNNSEEEQGLIRPQVKPPRLNGKKVGLFSVRSPHRPNPIGLTLATIEQVDLKKGELLLSGVDLIDGTPVLDIKPYISRYDSVFGGVDIYGRKATGYENNDEKKVEYKEPEWIDLDPVVGHINSVEFTEEAITQIKECSIELDIEKQFGYKNWIDVREAIEQMLILDPRSIYRRKKCEDKVYWFHFDDLNLSTTIKTEGDKTVATVFKCEIWSKIVASLTEEEKRIHHITK
ncbi:predicted protein [Naegleria gruberi]|uniref:Predicted protein n=1 Tax=Naegleria gruberi TaxID=5762 RepID=D2V615_NAEGR|nr:uncharacterized protein NAEGRDRAFT_64276 [Naegleria gruberi]EFC47747.1 predicted protein [Naegleria gruberi]|eukprot:XP_002680491.1 predicted protein [Naegleria gruberi strain NEG-M]